MEDGEDLQKSRLKKVQEKNKRAQARYRQKQKEKMNTFEAECHQLTNQLKEMQKAYEMLHNEKLALEHSLKETRPTATSPSREAHRDERACPPAADESSRPVRPTPTGPSWAGYGAASERYYQEFLRNIVTKTLGDDATRQSDAEPFKYRPEQQVAMLYKGLMEELNARILRVDDEQNPKAQRDVLDMIYAMRTMGKVYDDNLTSQQRLEKEGISQHLLQAYGAPNSNHWCNVLGAARVSPGQRARILDLRQAHLQKIEGIVRKRKDVVWELQQATVMPESASSRQTAFAKTIKFSKQLQDNLLEEHTAKEIFYRNVCHQVLNEMQEARMLVASNPYMLDLAAICDLLAAEPDNLTHPTEEPQEPFGSRALPAILQIPAVVDNDLTPDQYLTAFACHQSNGLGNRFMAGAFPVSQPFGGPAPGQIRVPIVGLPGSSSGNGNVSLFVGGENSSGFAPLRPGTGPPKRVQPIANFTQQNQQ